MHVYLQTDAHTADLPPPHRHSHATAGLYNSIAAGEAAVWTFHIQTCAIEDQDNFDFDPLDDTKVSLSAPLSLPYSIVTMCQFGTSHDPICCIVVGKLTESAVRNMLRL